MAVLSHLVWIPIVGGVAVVLYGIWWCFEKAEATWQQWAIDDIMAENARVSMREQRLREWRLRDLDEMRDPATERRMHLVMKSSTRRVH